MEDYSEDPGESELNLKRNRNGVLTSSEISEDISEESEEFEKKIEEDYNHEFKEYFNGEKYLEELEE